MPGTGSRQLIIGTIKEDLLRRDTYDAAQGVDVDLDVIIGVDALG